MDKTPIKRRIAFDQMKLIEWFICIIFFLVTIFVIAGFFPISHPLITQYVHSVIIKSDIDSCFIGKVALIPWKGITFYDVVAEGFTNSNIGYKFRFSKIRVNLNVIRTLTKWTQIKPSFLQLREQFSDNFSGDLCSSIDNILKSVGQIKDINSILIDGKQLRIETKDALIAAAGRFSFDIYRDKDNPQILELDMEAAEFYHLKNVITFLKISAVYDEKTLKVNNCKGRIFDGKFKLFTELSLQDNYLFSLSLSSSRLDIKQIASLSGSSYGCYEGDVDFNLNLQPSSIHTDSIRGKGTINASSFKIVESPVQQSLADLFGIEKLTELNFDKVRIDFKLLNKDTINIETNGIGQTVSFKANGFLSFNGLIDQNIEASLSEDFVKGLPELVVNSLEPNENKGRNIRCRVYGTFSYPKVELDREIFKRTIGNVFEDMKENFKDFFRKK